VTNLVLERVFETPLTIAELYERVRTSVWCYDLHRVGWHGSFLAGGGHRLVCTFEAPDAESARTALRTTGADVRRLWTASMYEASPAVTPNVLVERSFAEPITFEQAHGLEEANGWCLEQHRVRWARSYLSTDGLRTVCFYQAPDAESVRLAQKEAGLPLDAVWSFERAGPDAMPAT
jgi:hypothetical protein